MLNTERRKQNIVAAVMAVLVLAPYAYAVSAYAIGYGILGERPEYRPSLSTRLYDINGELISELYEENRSYITMDKIPAHVPLAFIAAEDKGFHSHAGIDVAGMARAALADLASGELKQGGSTITQQLIKQIHTRGEKTIFRKLVELFLAREFERRFTKRQIMEMYLNQIYFGHGAYGIDAASRFYFDHGAEALKIAEACILASIPSAPNQYSPLKNPGLAYERSGAVLHAMIQQGYVSRGEAVHAFRSFWGSYREEIMTRFQALGVRSARFDSAPYFTEYMRRLLIERYGEERVYRGGLQIYTTLDLRCQRIAEEALREGLERQNAVARVYNRNDFSETLKKTRSGRRNPEDGAAIMRLYAALIENELIETPLLSSMFFDWGAPVEAMERYINEYESILRGSRVEGAFVALDPSDGAIVSMIGGGDFHSGNQLNRAVQSLRQPGSAFKAFVYGAGIESRQITAGTAFLDAPVVFKDEKKTWSPSNYEKSFMGRILARRALAVSLNVVSVLLYEKIGGGRIARFASSMMDVPLSRFQLDPTLALGSTELSPLEMAQGFAVYANGGTRVRPYAIKKILDRNGRLLHEASASPGDDDGEQVISRETSFIMTSMMRDVVERGTAAGAIRLQTGFEMPAAGKTGTTTDFRDAWFVGYTPGLVAAVWMGCDMQIFSLGPGQSGAVAAAPVWGNFMREVCRFRKPGEFFKQPAGVLKIRICSKTGKLPLADCPTATEYFIKGTEPKESCSTDHDEMMSVFDLIKKDKDALRKKRLQYENRRIEIQD